MLYNNDNNNNLFSSIRKNYNLVLDSGNKDEIDNLFKSLNIINFPINETMLSS